MNMYVSRNSARLAILTLISTGSCERGDEGEDWLL